MELTDQIVAKFQELMGDGKGLSAIVIMILAWFLVEHSLLFLKSKAAKRGTALAIGIGMTLLAQFAGIVTFGTEPGPAAAGAVFYGLAAGGLAILFHTHIIGRFIPALKRNDMGGIP